MKTTDRVRYTEGLETLNDLDLQVYYTQRVHPIWVSEECHGTHVMDQSLIETTIDFIDIEVFGESVNILPCLSEKQKEAIVRYINEKA
jgi:hypothetical protein